MKQALLKLVLPVFMLVLSVFLLAHFLTPYNTKLSATEAPRAISSDPSGNHNFNLSGTTGVTTETSRAQQSPASGLKSTVGKRRLLTLRFNGRTVRSLLNELSLTTGVVVHADELKLDSVVSANFVDATLEDVLLQLLRGYDVALLYKSGDDNDPQVTSVTVYPRGSTDEHASMAQSAGSELAHNVDAQILLTSDRIAQYLTDPDELHRARALAKAMSDGIRVTPSLLAQLVQNDGSALVRFSALSAIGMLPTEDLLGVEPVVVAALNDGDEPTRLHAQTILNSIRDRTR